MNYGIEYKKGNLLDVRTGVIAHGCNCMRAMGAGVAKAVRAKYPEAFEVYEKSPLKLGGVCGVATADFEVPLEQLLQFGDFATLKRPVDAQGLLVVNAMTQYRYGTEKPQVSYDAVEAAFVKIRGMLRGVEPGALVVNIPRIGAGLAGGDWNIIEGIIAEALPKEDGYKVVVWDLV